jgi:heptosyltransferase II
MKIAVFCPNWVGDMVMATPALRGIRRHFPRAEIVGVLRPYIAGVVEGLDVFDRTLLTDSRRSAGPPGRVGTALAGWDFARRIRAERFDLALLLPNSFRSALWASIAGARERVGFDRNGRGWMLTDPVRPPATSAPHPVIDEYLRLAAHLGCRHLSRNMELSTTTADEQRLEAFWRQQPGADDRARGVVCLNPGGAFGSAKHWPAASFGELARRIAGELEKRVLVLCGPAEKEVAGEIVERAAHPRVVSLANEALSIGLTKAAIRHSVLLITTDSGPRHFAPPFKVPVVTLFGPTHTAWSETYYKRSLHLQTEVDCGPCQMRVCPLVHHRCMTDLKVAWVFKAAVTMLEKSPAKKRAA